MLALRLPIATGWGGLFSLVIFWALWTLVDAPIEIGDRVKATRIEFTRLLTDSAAAIKPREEKPTWTPPQAPPSVPGLKIPTVGDPVRVVPDRGPIVDIPRPGSVVMSGTDHDAQPTIRVYPEYPPGELHRGIEGWVQVRFSVTATGMVRDVTVVDSYPANVFDEATIEAVRRWRYSPKVVDGAAVERIGLQTVIVFELDE